MEVLDTELSIGSSAIVVFHYAVADIYGVSGLDMVEVVGHIEGNGRDVVVWMRLLDKLKLQMAALCSDLTDISVIIYVVRTEDGHAVARAKRLELLEDTKELRCDLREVKHGICLNYRCLHFRDYGL